jgi:co-chaperonin GroES (HSP10)
MKFRPVNRVVVRHVRDEQKTAGGRGDIGRDGLLK